MTELVIDRPLDEAMEKHQAFLELMQGKGQIEPDEDVLEDGIAFAGVAKFPARVKCALLGWMAFKDATAQASKEVQHDRHQRRPDHGDLPEVDTAAVGTSTVDRRGRLGGAQDVVDPELGINVVDLGLIYDVTSTNDTNVVLDMTLTSAACPLTDVIQDQTNTALEGLVDDVTINWVWMPPWGPDKITDDGREKLRALGFNV